MSKMDSPVPNMNEDLLSLIDELVPNEEEFRAEAINNDSSSSSESDFGSDDTVQDPDFVVDSSLRNPFLGGLRSIPSEYDTSEGDMTPTTSTRKRQRKPEMWKQHIRKRLRESGEEYTSIKGKVIQKKKVLQPCKHTCFYLCSKNFSTENRENIHKSFWSLPDREKPAFYTKFVKQVPIKHRRVSDSTKKKQTFHFYLQIAEDRIHQVCKVFFLNTLCINEKRIYYFFNNLNENGCQNRTKRGTNIKKVIPQSQIKIVHDHIKSFPKVDSHYCRANSSRQYLESHLNITKMYHLYRECTNDPVKEHIYRREFNNSFNLYFYKPKKDQCDRCLAFKSKETPSTSEVAEYNTHKNEKITMKAERDLDRNNVDPKSLIICFDLQSVFSLPKGNASSFYYKRKLSVFNLTATVCPNKKPKITYCAIWSEIKSGRTGDDIASAIIKILKQVVIEHPQIEILTLWSDSCVPQNKNKIMATALMFFLHQSPNIQTIFQKCSVPGHSLIQEVDSVHSAIDKHLRNIEIHSPLALLRQLKNMNYEKVILKLIQMQSVDFKAYSIKAGYLNYASIPFSRIKLIKYEKPELFQLSFKTNPRDIEYQESSILKKITKSTLGTPKNLYNQELNIIQKRAKSVSKDKIDDIKSLFPFMSSEDTKFYEALFNKAKYLIF